MNKKQLKLLIGSIIYLSTVGFLIPIFISSLDLYGGIYDYFAELALVGVFFFIYLMTTIIFFPFIYSTLVKGKLSFNIERNRKKQRNPRFYSVILFLIGLPILIWLILGNLAYYSVTEVSGGLGDFALNGFLVISVVVVYFFILPAIILGLKKSRF